MIHSKLALLSSLKPSSLLASASSADMLGFIMGLVAIVVIVILLIVIVLVVSKWKIYEKAGVPGWSVLIPIYNQVKLLQITSKPVWWILLLFIPIVNIVLLIILSRRLAAVFGKGVGFTWGLVLLPFIFYPILAFGKSTYTNTYPPAGPMSEAVKWTLIAGFLFLLLETFAMVLGASSSRHSATPLTVISSDLGYASDDTYVYYYDKPILNADPSSFKVLTKDDSYAVDDHAVYYEDQILDGADPSSFKILKAGYAESDKNIYYEGETVSDADLTTFKILGEDGYAVDATAVYYDGVAIPGADPSTITLATDPTGNYNYDAKDANGYYSYGDPVTKDGKSLK